ncbi:DUF6788 family protein [Saliphagus sp. LR7]|uniref:DUF6788 family protein n=1 Tax=Saliphagus sp. LR7 TaxID=2282654 RepID=UPI0037439964
MWSPESDVDLCSRPNLCTLDVVEEGSSGTVYHEYRTCGDDTCQCMTGGPKHGPYSYRAYRDGDTVRQEYLGKAESE